MSLAKSFLWLSLAEILFSISGYVVHSGAGRLLTPEDYGRYGLIVTLSIMVITLIGNGIPISMSKYLSENYKKNPELISVIKRQALWLQVTLISIVSLAFYAFSPFISQLLHDKTLTPLFRISVFILPAYAIDNLYFYYMTGVHQFNIQATLKIVRSILRIILILGMIMIWKVQGAIGGYIIFPLLVFFMALIIDIFYVSKKFPTYNKKIYFNWKKLLHYAWPITLFMIFYEILISLDLYFIKALLRNDYKTGIYNSALMLARIPYYLFYALNIILLPSISSSMAHDNKNEAKNLISQSLRLLILILTPLVTLMAVYAEPTISFVFGNEYISGLASLQILVFGIGFLTIFYVLSFAQNGAGLARIPMWVAFWGMILNANLNYFMIQKFGIVGAAIATSFSSLAITVFSIVYTSIHFGKIISFISTTKIFIATLIMFGISFLLPAKNLLFIPFSLILTAIYVIILFLFKEITSKDLSILSSLLHKKPTISKALPE